MIIDYSGYWTGTISGTNQGGFTLDVHQDGSHVSGSAVISEPSLGQYEYSFAGTAADSLSLQMVPLRQSNGLFELGEVLAVSTLSADGRLSGRWRSSIGTEGVFTATRFEGASLSGELPKRNSVFLVHGHDEGTKHGVARFLEKLGVTPVILQEQVNRGMTVIEKFEEFAERAGFAIILLTPDDFGYPVGKEEEKRHRPRQNVVLELGFFSAKLGRDKTFVLIKGDVEMPSDILGLVYEQIDKSEGWKMKLARELKSAGFEVDMNKAIE